jgi:hypothetical protein
MRYVVRKSKSGYVVLDTQKQSTFAFATRENARKAAKKKERDYALKNKPKEYKDATFEQDKSTAVPEEVLEYVLRSVKQAHGVAEAWRKIIKRSPFKREAKEEINNAVEALVRKWRMVQCNLAKGE